MKNAKNRELEKKKTYTVVKSNILVLNSRYEYSLNQQKTLAYICSMIKPINDERNDGKYQLDYTFSISEYIQILDIESSGNQYNLIKDTLKSLSDKAMWLPIEDENGSGEILVRWLSSVIVYKKSGKVKVRLDEYLAPYLFKLQEKYLSYGLQNILNFKSKYSIRFYEMLKAQYNKKIKYRLPEGQNIEWNIKLEELKHILMIDESKYKNFKDFRVRILELAKKEINHLSDIRFDFNTLKKGKKVDELIFIIHKKD